MQQGQIFNTKFNGELVIVKYDSYKSVTVKFLDTGYETTTTAVSIRLGSVKDKMKPTVYGLGFLGDGPFKGSEKGKHTKLYMLWLNMIKRCYSDNAQKRDVTYIGCSVDPSWFNFQTFCSDVLTLDGYEQWKAFSVGEINEVYQLDKDIKVAGNKIYGPSFCSFVTISENVSYAQNTRWNK